MTPKKSVSLLGRNSVFRNFLAASTVSNLGSNIFDFAIPLYVFQRSGSVWGLSLASFAINLPFFLMAPLTGYTVDTFNKRRVMLSSDIGQTLCMLFLFAFDILPVSALWPILLAVFVTKTLTNTFETVATFQLIPALVDQKDLPEANTYFLSSQRLIQIIGPFTAGILLGIFGVRACIFVNAISFAATVYFVLKMKNLNELILGEDAVEPVTISLSAIGRNFSDSLRFIWLSPIFKPFICMMFAWNFSTLLPNSPTITYYFTAAQKFTTQDYSMVISLCKFVGIIGFIGAGTLYRKFLFHDSFVGAAIWIAVFGTFCALSFSHPFSFAGLFAFSQIGSSILSMGSFSIRQANIPKSKMGGVNACLRMFFMTPAVLSPLIQGVLITRFNVMISVALGAICLWGTLWYAHKTAIAYDRIETKTPKKSAVAA